MNSLLSKGKRSTTVSHTTLAGTQGLKSSALEPKKKDYAALL